nr:hypothetical protein [uncultured Leptotrichia sp.]
MEREHSFAYIDLIKTVKATGREKLDGYYSKTMEEIYDWERDEVEDIIWEKFQRDRDSMLSDFLPKLKKYDGITALEEASTKVTVPSYASIDISKTLYNSTLKTKYLDNFKENLGYDDIVLVSILNKCIVTEDLYNFLKELYLYYGVEKKEDKGVVTMLIIKGLLRCKGYMTLNFGASTEELREDFKIIKIFEVDEIESKKEIIKKLENGEILKSTESKEVLFQNNENHKNETPKSEEILLKKNKKPIEQTYDSIRNWLLPLLRKDDKIIFPKEEFLERVKLFDEAEKLRTFNVIKSAVEHDNYCVKFEEGKTIRGYEVIKAFGEMLGIDVEEEVVEKIEKTEVEEEKKLTPQQLRKKKFLERMKKSEEKNNRKKKEVI